MKHFPILTLALLLIAAAAKAQQPATAPVPAASVPSPGQFGTAVPATSDALECRVLTGRVTDRFAYPLTGASVMLRSRNKAFAHDAFVTNAEGQYMVTSKQDIPRDAVLEITASGYTSVALPPSCQPQDVTLEPLPGTRFKSNGRIKKTSAAGKIH